MTSESDKAAQLFVERALRGYVHSDWALIVALVALGFATGLAWWWLVVLYVGVQLLSFAAVKLLSP